MPESLRVGVRRGNVSGRGSGCRRKVKTDTFQTSWLVEEAGPDENEMLMQGGWGKRKTIQSVQRVCKGIHVRATRKNEESGP